MVKLAKSIQEENLSSVSYTYYQGNYIYEKSSFTSPLTLKFISHPEGYIEPNVTSSAQPAGGQGVEMDYV